jgi:hypothetical protein
MVEYFALMGFYASPISAATLWIMRAQLVTPFNEKDGLDYPMMSCIKYQKTYCLVTFATELAAAVSSLFTWYTRPSINTIL